MGNHETSNNFIIRRQLIYSTLSRTTNISATLIQTYVVSKYFGMEQLGYLVTWFSISALIATLIRAGLAQTIVIINSEFIHNEEKHKFLNFSNFSIIIPTLIAVFAVLLCVIGDFFITKVLTSEAIIFILMTPVLVASVIFGSYHKSINKAYLSPVFEGGGGTILSIILLVTFNNFNLHVSFQFYALLLLSSLYICFILPYVIFLHGNWAYLDIKFFRNFLALIASYKRQNFDFLIVDILAFTQQYGIIIIAGIFLASKQVGEIAVYLRISLTLNILLLIIQSFVQSRIVYLFKKENLVELRKLINECCMLLWCGAIVVLGALVLFLDPLLYQFSLKEYNAAAIFVMLIGQFLNVATGPTGPLLNMTGFQKDVRDVTFKTFGMLIVLLPLGAQAGVIGFCCAFAISTAYRAIALYIRVKVNLGFYIHPIIKLR